MPDRIMIDIFTLKPLNLVEDFSSQIDILESSSHLKPTHWGKDGRPRSKRKYTRDKLLSYVNDKELLDELYLYRDEQPTYTIFYFPRFKYSSTPSSIHWSFEKDVKTFSLDVAQEIFEVSSNLAGQVEAIFGYTWTPWDDNEDWKRYMPSSIINAIAFADYGPNPVHVRTWYGSYLIEIIGRKALVESGALIKETSWGGVELDLVEEPWNSSLDEILKRQQEVMAVLGRTEVFGDYRTHEAGKRWIPFSKSM